MSISDSEEVISIIVASTLLLPQEPIYLYCDMSRLSSLIIGRKYAISLNVHSLV